MAWDDDCLLLKPRHNYAATRNRRPSWVTGCRWDYVGVTTGVPRMAPTCGRDQVGRVVGFLPPGNL